MNTPNPKPPQSCRELTKLALSITRNMKAALHDAVKRRRIAAIVNAKVREFVAAGVVEAGWTAVVIETRAGIDIQYTRA